MTGESDRRLAVRLRCSQWQRQVGARIRPGHVARVIDLSTTGAFVASALRLTPGAFVDLQLHLDDERHDVRARVVRSEVSVLRADAVVFASGLAFERPLGDLARADGTDEPRPGT